MLQDDRLEPMVVLYPEIETLITGDRTWEELPTQARIFCMDKLLQQEFGVRVYHGEGFREITLQEESEMLEWSLRNKTLHPDLSIIRYEPEDDEEQ